MNDQADQPGTPAQAARPPEPVQSGRSAGTSDDRAGSEKSAAGAGQKAPPATAARPRQTDRAPRDRSGAALGLAVLALLAALGLGGAGYYVRDQVTRLQAAQQSVVAALKAQVARVEQQSAALADELHQSVGQARAERERLSSTLDSLAAGQRAIEAGLAQARAAQRGDPTEWVLAEVRYLLYLANQRLQLARDVAAALAALAAADARLQQLGDPGLLPIRQQIARERDALKAVPVPDVDGIDASLASLTAGVDSLPVAGVRPPVKTGDSGRPSETGAAEASGPDGLKAAGERVWRELQQLVVVRHQAGGVVPMLAPEEAYFLRRNLELQLEAARLGLLRGSSALYRNSLRQARDWLQRHFDAGDPAVQATVAEIERLSGIEVAPALPDISGSLALVRKRLALGSEPAGAGNAP